VIDKEISRHVIATKFAMIGGSQMLSMKKEEVCDRAVG
jgi:hypothetical protein